MAYVMTTKTITATVPFGDNAYGAVVYNGNVYINTADKIYKYEPVNNLFSLLFTKTYTTIIDCVLYNGALYTIGYLAGSSGVAVYKYDIETHTYSTFTSYSAGYTNRIFQYGGVYYRGEYIIFTMLFYGNGSYTGRTYSYIYNTTTNSGSWYYSNAPDNSEYYCVAHQVTDYFYFSGYTYRSNIYGYQLLYGYYTSISNSTTFQPGRITGATLGTSPANFSGAGTFKFNNLYYIICGNSAYTYNATANTFTQLSITNPFTSKDKYCAQVGADVYMFYSSGVYKISFVDYNLTYTIKNKTGDETYVTLTGQSPITQVRFNYTVGSSTVGYVLSTLTGNITGSYTPNVPSGYKLVGFGSAPNTKIALAGLNMDVAVTIDEDFTFYEIYQVYKPPATTFEMNLYQNTAENNRVDKTNYLTSVGSIFGALRSECSIIRPSIIIEQKTLPTFNYVYIGAFGRYYFVTGITSVAYRMWRIELSTDVLMTYKNGITLLTAIIARQENDYNDDLIDTEVPTEKEPTVTYQEIPNTVLTTQEDSDKHSFVVTVVGN